MSSQFGLPPGMMMQGNPFLAAAYSAMFKQQGVRDLNAVRHVESTTAAELLRATSLQQTAATTAAATTSHLKIDGNNMKPSAAA